MGRWNNGERERVDGEDNRQEIGKKARKDIWGEGGGGGGGRNEER